MPIVNSPVVAIVAMLSAFGLFLYWLNGWRKEPEFLIALVLFISFIVFIASNYLPHLP